MWSVLVLDMGGRWGWEKASREELRIVLAKLQALEGMTWSQITVNDRTGCHSVEIARIVRPAQRRLQEIRMDDIDQLYSVRIDGQKRVWGIRQRNVLKVLWWDPKHEVCPALLRRT